MKIWKANGSSVNLLASKGQTIAVSQIRQIALMKRPTRLLFSADALVSPQAIVTCAFYEKIKVHVAFQWKVLRARLANASTHGGRASSTLPERHVFPILLLIFPNIEFSWAVLHLQQMVIVASEHKSFFKNKSY